jgi:hydrogenase maturation protein HypF
LSHPSTLSLFEETIVKLERLYQLEPAAIAHDLHPDYRSTRWAMTQRLPRVPIQHHHAHVAACLAEHGRLGPAIGVAFDGTGCGPDGELWGGEFLAFDLAGFRSLGHLMPLALPGGEAAIRRPWKLAVAALTRAHEPIDCVAARINAGELAAVRRLIASAPRARSAGRWFDAVAALLQVRDEISYEAQAAIELEALAGELPADSLPYEIEPGQHFVVNLDPAIRRIARSLAAGAMRSELAASFHETMAKVVVAGCRSVREQLAFETVVLSGGCFQNARLTARSTALLSEAGFEVLVHRRVPANDGGVSFGQAAVAAYRQKGGPGCVSEFQVR